MCRSRSGFTAELITLKDRYRTIGLHLLNLIAHGYGRDVYWFLRSTFDMSLCMRKEAYYGAVELIYKVSLHLDNRWCTSFPA